MQEQHYRKNEFDGSFDEWLFLEIYMTDYYHSDEIAAIDDIDCYLNDGGVNHSKITASKLCTTSATDLCALCLKTHSRTT